MPCRIITAVEVNDSGDAPMFKQLMATTAQNFTVREASADKAYSSFENLELVEEIGATPYIAFKVNARPSAGICGEDARDVHAEPRRVSKALP
jgi:hypothetical protein